MAWVMPVITGLVDVMEMITFVEFIEEESMQSAALGTFLALRAGSIHGASIGITTLRTITSHLRQINDTLGWIAIYSKGCFADFVVATEANLVIYDMLLKERALKKK